MIKSTLLISLDVGKSRILTMRGLTKTRTKWPLRARGANGLVFSACKLNLPLVPSQDNKRCYDTILSDWNLLKTKSNNNNWMTTPTMYIYCAKEDDGLTEGAYCSCTAGYEIYACFFQFSIVSMQCQFRTIR